MGKGNTTGNDNYSELEVLDLGTVAFRFDLTEGMLKEAKHLELVVHQGHILGFVVVQKDGSVDAVRGIGPNSVYLNDEAGAFDGSIVGARAAIVEADEPTVVTGIRA